VQVPEDRTYTEEHEWVMDRDGIGRIGITDYAQEKLGDIVFVALPEEGRVLAAGEVMAEVESTKSVGEVYAPFAGTVAGVNGLVDERPELVNSDPYGEGWLVDLHPGDGVPTLLSAAAYRALLE
jgi:glycine cleavage system H protein